MKTLITIAAIIAACITVLSTRLLIPALIVVFRSIEAGFAPAEEPAVAGALPVSVVPLAAVSEPIEQRQDKPAPRKARRRKPSAKTLARAEAALA